jgi:secreted trypsin-like serine protease
MRYKGFFSLAKILPALVLLLIANPAHAVIRGEMVGNNDGPRSSIVRVESSKGELCSGVLIAPDVVLTAAHCVAEQAKYRVVGLNRSSRTRSVKALAASMHPDFVPGTTPRNQPGIDLALLLMEQPLGDDFTPLDVSQTSAIDEGERVTLLGFGLSRENAKSTARTLRQTSLLAVGMLQVANRVQIVVDPVSLGETSGAGACRGDSGGPVLRGSYPSYTLVGIVSWSSGPLNARARNACGGLTAITPVSPHTSWIQRRSQSLRDANQNADTPAALLGGTYDWTVR